MSDYTHKNLLEAEDDAAKHGMGEILEGYFPRDLLGCRQTGVSLQRIKPGRRMPFGHNHKTDEEIYVVVAGSGTALLGDDRQELRPMDAVRLAPETLRAFEAGPDGLELLAFGTHHDDDSVMAPDAWSRRGA